jgi:sialidase-1
VGFWRRVLAPACGLAAATVVAVPVAGEAADTVAAAPAESHSEMILFDGGDESFNIRYHSFRIPSLVRTKNDTLLAFVEGRADNNDDFGNINLLYKRSTDNGATWSELGQVAGGTLGKWGNPTPVVDRDTGRIWMFMNRQPAGHGDIDSWDDVQVWVSYSDNDGQSFTEPVDMSEQLKPKTKPNGEPFTLDQIGPGTGIQTEIDHPGRLVVPAYHRFIYSDDHGATWKTEFMETTDGAPMLETGESTVVELADGSLYRNDRPTSKVWDDVKRRQVAKGTIENGFTPFAAAECLLDPKNEGSTMRYNLDGTSRIAFVNSASTVDRLKMRIRISEDEGKTWSYSRAFSDAPLPQASDSYVEGGYSSIVKTADFHVGALIEVNEQLGAQESHRSISFRKVNLPWIQGGIDNPDCSGGI